MEQNEFLTIFGKLVNYIVFELDRKDGGGAYIDFDFNDEVVTIQSLDGTFILNRQIFLQEVWLSSPVSGPYHFQVREGNKFVNSKGVALFQVLSAELGISFCIEDFLKFM